MQNSIIYMMATPRKLYSLIDNICELCGFSFLETEILPDGTKKVTKHLTNKLRLNPERISAITSVLEGYESTNVERTNNGVCLKCFRNIQKCIKLDSDLKSLKTELSSKWDCVKRSQLALPSPSKHTITKRLLRSPSSTQITKTGRIEEAGSSVVAPSVVQPFVSIQPVKLVKLPPLGEVIVKPKSTTKHQEEKLPDVHVHVPMLPLEEVVPRSKKQLFGEPQKENIFPDMEGAVEVTVHYPSGKKSALIVNECYKKVCKKIVSNQNVELGIVAIISDYNKDAVSSVCCKIISKECKELCRRNSGSVLQKKGHHDLMNFSWDKFNQELQIRAPHTLKVISAIVVDIPSSVTGKKYLSVLHTMASGLHGRSAEMSALQYIVGFIMTHGGCTLKDIQRLSALGLTMSPGSIHNKLLTWQEHLDVELLKIKREWECGGKTKYQLVGDNWDKNILPSYRTSQQTTESVHLFNVLGVVDRINPVTIDPSDPLPGEMMPCTLFIPSLEEQGLLLMELTFIVATSLIRNISSLEKEFGKLYPQHLEHAYSTQAGIKTSQYHLGLFDCNETKTKDVIQLLKKLSTKYVPRNQGQIHEEVFFGGDRLTDERVQGAQNAMLNAATPVEKLQGFVSKTEDFHRLMNFLEAIGRMTYSTESGADRGTVYYYRNLLNARNVKGEVKNGYRGYKHLYYTIFDAICCGLFMKETQITSVDDNIVYPENFKAMDDAQKINWINDICKALVQKYFFTGDEDIMRELREIISDPDHPENYWTNTIEEDGKVRCHFCAKRYTLVDSLIAHEKKVHNHVVQKRKVSNKPPKDSLYHYIMLLFKMVALHKNLDTAVDMADGHRSVRSAKYELPIYNRTNKIKYVIGSIHLTALTSGILSHEQQERLTANRFINLQGGKNHNMGIDEYVELLNRDSKFACSGFQTKESIIAHSKEFPHLISMIKHYDLISEIHRRKGFHKLPSYKEDVKKVLKDLIEINALEERGTRTFKCKKLTCECNPFSSSHQQLTTLIHRHKPSLPFARLRQH